MNNEQLQAAKDQAAREYGHVDFDQALAYCFAMNGTTQMMHPITDRAMEIYAEMMVKEALTNAEEKRRTMFDDATELY